MTIPRHIAIIMDGNARWAKKHKLPKMSGYRYGISVAENIIQASKKLKIEYLTLFAFSSENWSRPKREVSELMNIFRHYLKHKIDSVIEQKVKITFLGDMSRMPLDIQELMRETESKSKQYTDLTVTVAVSYGAKTQILNAVTKLLLKYQATKCNDSNNITSEKINDEFNNLMNPHKIPDPDLLIRTSGEIRLSNFLLWQLAYTELYFTNTLWPDFKTENLEVAIQAFSRRNRKYGK